MKTGDWQWLMIFGATLIVAGLTGWPSLGMNGEDRVYLTVGTFLGGLGWSEWRGRERESGSDRVWHNHP